MDRIAELEAQVARLLAIIADLEQWLARSEARCAALEARLNADSGNSHSPPSAAPPIRLVAAVCSVGRHSMVPTTVLQEWYPFTQ